MKHNLNEAYLQSLTEDERNRQMSEWTPDEWKQYLCPNGTISLEEFRMATHQSGKQENQRAHILPFAEACR